MAKFKTVALKSGEEVVDDLYEYDEPDLNREDLDLSKINIYLHQISKIAGVDLFRLKVSYGKITADENFFSLEDQNSDEVYSSLKIQQFLVFDYTTSYNCLRIEVLDPSLYDDVSANNQ